MKWIDCKDRLPPNDKHVIVAIYDGRPKVEMYFVRICKRMNHDWFDDHNEDKLQPKYGCVTHWMPIPDDPIRAKMVDEL